MASAVQTEPVTKREWSHLAALMREGMREGKLPLFVIGSGVSAATVPRLSEMTAWLLTAVRSKVQDPAVRKQLIVQGEAICNGGGTRADAAGFFSALQQPESGDALGTVWKDFTRLLALTGLPRTGGGDYKGLFNLIDTDCSATHRIVASLLRQRRCHALNLNYDPLLSLASQGTVILPLYNPEDIVTYYTANKSLASPPQAAVTNARGDVFFSQCDNPMCPQQRMNRIIDSTSFSQVKVIDLCPICHQHTSHLQLSFPGHDTKERAVREVVRTLRRYIQSQVSAIVCLGFSGQWDRFLVFELFELASSNDLPILDVRPIPKGTAANGFTHVNYFVQLADQSFPDFPITYDSSSPCLALVDAPADAFMGYLTAAGSLSLPQESTGVLPFCE